MADMPFMVILRDNRGVGGTKEELSLDGLSVVGARSKRALYSGYEEIWQLRYECLCSTKRAIDININVT